jgi:hypothetical protein
MHQEPRAKTKDKRQMTKDKRQKIKDRISEFIQHDGFDDCCYLRRLHF